MAKGFGIAALICALLALAIPLVGIVVSGIAIVLAIIAALSGDRVFATATSLIAGINTFFLSPSVMLVLHTSPAAPVIGGFLFLCAAAPIGVVVGKSMLDQSSPRKDEGLPERAAYEPDGHREAKLKPIPETAPVPSPPKPWRPVFTNTNQSGPERFDRAEAEIAAYRSLPDHSEPSNRNWSEEKHTDNRQTSPDLRFSRADRIYPQDRTRDLEKRSLAVDATRKWERLLLIPFLGNYVINNIVAGSVSLIPASTDGGLLTPQYIAYVIFAAIVVALLTSWYLNPLPRMNAMKWGIVFGVSGYIISLLTTLVSGIASVLAQSGSFEQVASVLPNFGPFLWNSSSLFLLGFWVIPAMLVGCAMQFLQIRRLSSLSIE